MKNFYEKPDAEYIELLIHDSIMGMADISGVIGEDDEEGI